MVGNYASSDLHNSISITYLLAKKINVNITRSSISEVLRSDPTFPSLNSINKALQTWRIETMALRVQNERIGDLPTPFLTFVKLGSGHFVLVESVDDVVVYSDHYSNGNRVNRDVFLSFWNNTALLAERTSESGEVLDWKLKILKVIEDYIPLFLIGALVIAAVVFSCLNTSVFRNYLISSSVIKSLGIYFTYNLLVKEFSGSNEFIKSVCGAGKRTACDKVLSSRGSKLFGVLSWSEIGFSYFTVVLILMTFAQFFRVDIYPLLLFLAVLGSPYIVYSIVYQRLIVKQWCKLCLIVQGIIFLDLLVLLFPGVDRKSVV
jgi:uncharacterized membrane protein